MQKILLFGAGKSATVLIDYLVSNAIKENWLVTVADSDLNTAQQKVGTSTNAKAVAIEITNDESRGNAINDANIVISLLPPALHFLVAKDCVHFSKNLLTASYIDDKIKSLQKDIDAKGLLFLCEMGLDPGIDHMSAMKIVDKIHANGGVVNSFKSHCGGLVAPVSDDNPWHYKISWNPRNIVLAGKAGAIYKLNGEKTQVLYDKVFEKCPEVNIESLSTLAWYPNRDSLSYAELYGLETASTFLRTTLRYASFCRGWDVICHLALTDTDDEEKIKNLKTIHEWIHFKLNGIELREMDWMEYLRLYVDEEYHTEVTEQFDFLDLFETKPIPTTAKSSADILQYLLEARLVLNSTDKDMIVMLHEIESEVNSKKSEVKSTLIVEGEDSLRTAMAKTVGLPLGIAAKLILKKQIQLTGLHIPIVKEIYEPVLNELEQTGIRFQEEEIELS